jgi:hypothetical protein
MKFYGKILITDPCYIMTDKAWEDNIYEEDLSKYGNFIQHETGIGDIAGSVYLDEENIGNFCVDSGMFGVFQLDQLDNQIWFDKDKFDSLGNWCCTIVDGSECEIDCVVNDKLSDEIIGTLFKFYGTKDGKRIETRPA